VKYKRNQIEEAISRVLEPRSRGPTSELRTRLKRLFETDRLLGRNLRPADPMRANYAFYTADAPGSGVEVWFSEYEAFAVLNGVGLMQHGWPQGFAVSVMRRVRPDLEKEHARILKQNIDSETIRQKPREGDPAFGSADPVYLTIFSNGSVPDKQEEPITCEVIRGEGAALAFVRRAKALAWTMFELTTVAHLLAEELATTEPRRRGRGG
jgi:hypothetical protein